MPGKWLSLSVMLVLLALWGAQYVFLDAWRADRMAGLQNTPGQADPLQTLAAELPPAGEAEPDAVDAILRPGDASGFVERPLFTPSRRPHVPEEDPVVVEEPPPEPEPEPLHARLRSVVIVPSGAEIWLEPDDGDRVRLREGDRHRGWRVARIEHTRAVFERDGRTVELVLRPAARGRLDIDRVPPETTPAPLP